MGASRSREQRPLLDPTAWREDEQLLPTLVYRASRLLLGVACGVGLCEDQGVAQGRVDSDAEEVADAADVAAGREDLLEDAVLAQGLW